MVVVGGLAAAAAGTGGRRQEARVACARALVRDGAGGGDWRGRELGFQWLGAK